MITLPITCKQLFFSVWLGLIILSTFIMIYNLGIGLVILITVSLTGIAVAFMMDYVPIKCKCDR